MQKKIVFLIRVLLLWSTSFIIAGQICIPDESIIRQKKKMFAQGLFSNIKKSSIKFDWPVLPCRCWISSLFGPRGSGYHTGVDLAAFTGTDVFASAPGSVDRVEKHPGYGNMILLSHPTTKKGEFYYTRYAHLDKTKVFKGQKVKRGQKIGTVGSSGHSVAARGGGDSSHLHFEIYEPGVCGKKNKHVRVDPLKYLLQSFLDKSKKSKR